MKKIFEARTDDPELPPSDHRVVLIPGFLGFDKLGDFGYFAKEVGQLLADALQGADPGRKVFVDAVDTIPAGSLARRQEHLIKHLQEIRAQHPQTRHLHLVGHSTGGLDAELLVRTPWVCGEEVDVSLLQAVRSVIALAAPFSGTTLAKSALARLLAIDSLSDLALAPLSLLTVRGPANVARALLGVAGLFVSDDALAKLISGALRSGGVGASYVLSLLLSRALIDDLHPDKVASLMTSTREIPTLNVERSWFLTVSRRGNSAHDAASTLFRVLYDNTAQEAQKRPIDEELRRALAAAQPKVIGEPPLPELHAGASDGIVNTLRQVPPCDSDTIAREVGRVVALVIADHIDVIGYFPREQGRGNGFLNSGSRFREPALKDLYRTIARRITERIQRTTSSGSNAPRFDQNVGKP